MTSGELDASDSVSMALQLLGSKLQTISQNFDEVDGQIVTSSSNEVCHVVEANAAD